VGVPLLGCHQFFAKKKIPLLNLVKNFLEGGQDSLKGSGRPAYKEWNDVGGTPTLLEERN
jgi:hypothetical protein